MGDSDEKSAKPKVLIFEDGIDRSVSELKAAGIKTINKKPVDDASTHGTAVAGVYVRTLKRLLKTYYGKEIDLKDYVSIHHWHNGGTMQGALYNRTWQVNDKNKDAFLKDKKYIPYIKNTHTLAIKWFQNIGSYKSVNVSYGFKMADYNFVSDDILNDLFKKSVQQGTFIAVSSGNYQVFTSNDRWPASNPYVCSIGAYYSDNTIKSDNETSLLRNFGGCNPSASTWFSAPGYHLTYNTVSTRDYFGDDGYWYALDPKSLGADKNVPKRKKKIYTSGTSLSSPYVLAIKDFFQIIKPELDNRNAERLLLMATEKLDTKKLRSWWHKEIAEILHKPHQNAARGWNNERKTYYFEYGFGGLSESKVMHLAKIWEPQPIKEIELTLKPTKYVEEQGMHTYYYNCADDYQVFNIQARFKSSHARKELSELSVESPSGTRSYVYVPDYSPKSFHRMLSHMSHDLVMRWGDDAYAYFQYCEYLIHNRAMSMHFNGEKTKGPWILRSNVPLNFDQQKIIVRANKWLVDNIYPFDNGILNVAKPVSLVDTDGGKNTIDLSLYTKGKTIVDFKKRSISFMVSGKVKKTVPIGKGVFQTVLYSPLGGTTVN